MHSSIAGPEINYNARSATDASEERDIPREMRILNAAITELDEQVQRLLAKVHPAMALSPPKTCDNATTAPSSRCICPLAAGVWELRGLVQKITQRVLEANERVQL